MKRVVRLAILSLVVLIGSLLSYPILRNDNMATAGLLPDGVSLAQDGTGSITAERSGITVRLISAQFSSSRTLLTLEMKHPTISEDVNGRALFLPMRNEDVKLEGIVGDSIKALGRNIARQGLEQVKLELGAVAQPAGAVVFEILRLNVRRPEGGYEPIMGPWRFELTSPAAIGSPPVQYTIDKQIEISGVQNALDAVELAEDRTIVRFRTSSQWPGEFSSAGPPAKIRLPDGSELRGQGGGGGHNPGRGQPDTMSFPPIPRNVSRFSVEFGPYLVSANQSATLALPLPARVGDLPSGTQIVLQQNVLVGAAEYRPSLIFGPSEIKIAFEPANEPAKSNLVAGQGAKTSLTDDGGTDYVWAGTEGRVISEKDGASVAFQSFRFQGTNPEARELRLQVERTGQLLRGPWVFDVVVPR